MATRGYNSYRGRVSTGRIVLIVVLVLILLGAVGYLAVQNYLVYDEAGQVHLELPWGRHDGTPTPDKTPLRRYPTIKSLGVSFAFFLQLGPDLRLLTTPQTLNVVMVTKQN